MPNSSEGFDLYWFGLTNSLISRDGELTKVSIDGDATILDTNWFYSSGDEDFHAVYCVLADEEEDC